MPNLPCLLILRIFESTSEASVSYYKGNLIFYIKWINKQEKVIYFPSLVLCLFLCILALKTVDAFLYTSRYTLI